MTRKAKNKILYLVMVSFPYEGGWIVGLYDKESTAKRIKTLTEASNPAKIIPLPLNKEIRTDDKYL